MANNIYNLYIKPPLTSLLLSSITSGYAEQHMQHGIPGSKLYMQYVTCGECHPAGYCTLRSFFHGLQEFLVLLAYTAAPRG